MSSDPRPSRFLDPGPKGPIAQEQELNGPILYTWTIGTLDHCTFGPLDFWIIELWASAPVELWTFGLDPWTLEPVDLWAFGIVDPWISGPLDNRTIGQLGHWILGALTL